MTELSVIIPAYNEEKRLLPTLQNIYDFLKAQVEEFEIVIVNDGSKDGTVNLVEEFAKHNDYVRLISYEKNQGKGYAVRTGVLAAKGNIILVDDADGSSPIEEIISLIAAISQGTDVAIGSRNKPDPTRTVKALAYRTYMGNTFNTIVQSFLLPGLYDTQCGFKAFKNFVAKDIFSHSKVNGYAFDVEILYIAKIRGYRIEEIAINWTNVAGSKINVLVDSFKMLLEVFRIWLNATLGRYSNHKRSNLEEG